MVERTGRKWQYGTNIVSQGTNPQFSKSIFSKSFIPTAKVECALESAQRALSSGVTGF